jgi:hypothetical protein
MWSPFAKTYKLRESCGHGGMRERIVNGSEKILVDSSSHKKPRSAMRWRYIYNLGVLTGTALIAFHSISIAHECARDKYITTGNIHDSRTREPIPEAIILLFADDSSHTAHSSRLDVYPDYTLSRMDGTYVVNFFFNPTVSKFPYLWSTCDGTPYRLDIIVLAHNYQSKRVILRGPDLQWAEIEQNSTYELKAPTIYLDPISRGIMNPQ